MAASASMPCSAAMAHQNLIGAGVAHFAGPLLIDLDGDQATALNYSLVMRREGERFYLWRVSAVRWDLARTDEGWRVTSAHQSTPRRDSAPVVNFSADALTELFTEGAT